MIDYTEFPLVTIYIPCRNYGRFLPEALESVRKQLYTNWELFIVDEGSDDESLTIAKAFRATSSNPVFVLENKLPEGLQRVANKVLRACNGKYLIRLDADDWFTETALLALVAKIESDTKTGMVYGNFYLTDEKGKILKREQKLKLGSEDISFNIPAHGACSLVSTKLLKSSGGYREDVDAQDGWDLWLKILSKAAIANIEDAVFYYRQHGNSLSQDSKRLSNARATIVKRTVERHFGDYELNCLAVLPIKKSSMLIQNDPSNPRKKSSLLEISVKSILDSLIVQNVIVESDDPQLAKEIKDIQKRTSKQIFFRQREMTGKNEALRPKDILKSAATFIERNANIRSDIVMFLSSHAICRTGAHIDQAINTLIAQNADSVVSVQPEREPMFKHGMFGLELLNAGRFEGLSLERENLYRFNGSLIGCWVEILRQDQLFGNSISYIEMDHYESVQVKPKVPIVE